jgi:hypothetical protein
MQEFAAPGAIRGTWTTGINDGFAIVGYYYEAGWVSHGFLLTVSAGPE